MKLRDEDRRWLAEEISKQVKKAVADAIDKFRPHGWRRVTFWLREWGIAGAIITAFIALIAIAATAFYSLRSTPPMEGHEDSGEPVGPERFVLESKD